MGWSNRLLSLFSPAPRVATRETTHDNPPVIASPRLGTWNLLGPAATAAVNEDRAALAPLFATTVEGGEAPPFCDVLLMYCRLEPDGRVVGSALWTSSSVAASPGRNDARLVANEQPVEYGAVEMQ